MVEVGVFQGNLSRHVWQRSASLPGQVGFPVFRIEKKNAWECENVEIRSYTFDIQQKPRTLRGIVAD